MTYTQTIQKEWLLPDDEWTTVGYPGIFGKQRNKLLNRYDREYGAGNWQVAYQWGYNFVHRDFALLLYEDGYYHFLKSRPDLVEWLTVNYRDVYDNSPGNTASGFDYYNQESKATHLQDVAIRRVLLRMGKWFKGEKLLEIYGEHSEGFVLNPGQIPFHLSEMIVGNDKNPPWSKPDSVEAFWQCNKVLLVRKNPQPSELFYFKKTTVVLLAADADNKLLSVRTKDSPFWQLPYGEILSGETERDAASRIVREQSKHTVESVENLTFYTRTDHDNKTLETVLVMRVKVGDKLPDCKLASYVKHHEWFAPGGYPQKYKAYDSPLKELLKPYQEN